MTIDNVKTITVIGAGAMGRQIAMNTAIKGLAHGYRVFLCDSFPQALESASDWAETYLEGRVKKGRLSEEDVKLALKEVRMALLEADVNFKVVKQFVKSVEEKAVGEDI